MVGASALRRTVWIVDDSPLDAERARRALEPTYQVEVLQDGAAALERLAHGVLPDVLLLDWVMPGVSGIEVCRFIRAAAPPLRDLEVLLLTMQRETRQVVEGLSAGANDHVAKPFVEEELRARVDALARARALRERAEGAEALARKLVQSGADPLLAIDPEGKIRFANDAAHALCDEEPPALVGRPIADVLPGLPQHNVNVGPGESLFPLPDLTLKGRTYSPVLRLLEPHEGATTGVTLRDVTDVRRADARRLDFYSIMAHDLRSPLSSTLLRVDLMLRGKHGVMPPRVVEDLRKIDHSLKGLVAMINDFLELARLQGVGLRLERSDVDLVALVDEVMDDLAPLVELHRLSWAPVRPARAAVVPADRRRLRQVLSNLVANAIKFTPDEGRITTRVLLGDRFAEVQVEDTGRGIAPGALPLIFERFTREVDVEHQVAGSGLGLMIVRDIVRAHGGRVGVESEPGAGSRFWFRLPREGTAAP